MKLLTRKELKENIQGQDDRKFAQSFELVNEKAKLTKELNALRDLIRNEKVMLEKVLVEELNKLEQDRDGLKKEVEALEARKVEALKPIKERLKEVQKKETENDFRAASLTEKEETLAEEMREFDDRKELLTQRIDQLSLRDEKSKAYEEKAKAIKQASEVLYQSVLSKAKNIEDHLFQENLALEENKKVIQLERLEVKAKREHLDLILKTIEKEEEKLQSERSKLAVAIKVAKEKYGYKG